MISDIIQTDNVEKSHELENKLANVSAVDRSTDISQQCVVSKESEESVTTHLLSRIPSRSPYSPAKSRMIMYIVDPTNRTKANPATDRRRNAM
jgi:hypothetical protein